MDRQRILSEKNPYWLERHRFYELRHFCLQYPYWVEQYKKYDGLAKKGIIHVESSKCSSPTENAAIEAIFYKEKMEQVEKCCKEAADDLYPWLFKGVTEGIGYNNLDVPCCKDVYYDIFRKFFWLLDRSRN